MTRGNSGPKRFRWRWAVVGLAVLVVLAGAGFAREILRSRQIDKEIASLRTEAESLRAKNLKILSLKSSLDSGEFLEREARMKLGLQKEGEKVVVLRSGSGEAGQPGQGSSAAAEVWDNPKKWFMYFADRPAYDEYARRVSQAASGGGTPAE